MTDGDPDGIDVRHPGSHELEAFAATVEAAFAVRLPAEERERLAAEFDTERSLAAFEGRHLVATLAAYVTELGLPGGADAAVTALVDIGVLAPHRGRGILRAMMCRLIEDAHRRGEPLLALNADVGALYRRFGFGAATFEQSYTVPSGAALLGGQDTELALLALTEEEATEVLPAVFAAARHRRAGESTRAGSWWADHFAAAARHPVPQQVLAARRGDTIEGYLVWSLELGAGGQPEIVVSELVATDAAVERRLAGHLLSLHQAPRVNFRERPVDDLVLDLVADRRPVSAGAANDQLWLRLVDVPAALASRRYAAAGELVLGVSDALAPWNEGCFALSVDAGGAALVRAAERPVELHLEAGELAAAFLGGTSFRRLADAGRLIAEEPWAVAEADRLFAVVPAPYCATLL